MQIEEKRKFFLKALEEKCNKFSKMDKYEGAGFKRKLLRFIFAPKNYKINLILRKLKIYPKSKFSKIKLFWDKEIILNTRDMDGFELGQRGFLPANEIKFTKFLIKHLKETEIFYDVGASYGFYTYLALEFVKEVHLFEPIPEVFQILELNLKDKKNVYLNNFALSQIKGEQDLYVTEGALGSSTLIKNGLKYLNFFYRKIRVKTLPLDEYVKTHNPPTFLKLDVEGAESLVIEGGINFFKNFSPTISMEVWTKKRGGEISQKTIEKLRSLGYNSFLIKEDGEIESCSGNLTLKIPKSYEVDNFIFKKN